jgi:hypothetical protein
MIRTIQLSGGLSVLALAAAAPAAAQTFPADDSADWVAFDCGDVPSFDPRGDVPDYDGYEDVVGDATAPAVHRAVDADFLYLRLRVDAAVDLATELGGWGFAFDLDGDLTDYEVLLVADALTASPTVRLLRNTETTVIDSPRDPSDMELGTFALDTHVRTSAAPSDIGGPDAFVAVAVPLSALAPLAITPDTELRLWAGTTRAGNFIDGDLACHDSAGGSGSPPLDGSSSDAEPLDPDGGDDDPGNDDPGSDDPGSDDPGGDDGPRLEGGGGCAAAAGGSLLLPLVAAFALRRRHRRR